jgi:ElaB/YqjD/DUF883 family membrane-anchored ribosome-binding protein
VAPNADVKDAPATDRQVITTGFVTVAVAEPSDAASKATRIADSAGGRVDGRTELAPTNGDNGSATLTLRLPAAKLTATLDRLKQLGDVREVSLSSQDVTLTTQDLDARIAALTASVDRLLDLLAKAKDTSALVEIETALSDRQAELESLKSERRYYSDQVTLATITLNLVSVTDAPADSFWSGVISGWSAFVGFFAGLLVAVGFWLPWLVLAAIAALVIARIVRRRRAARTAPEPEPAPTRAPRAPRTAKKS